MREEAEYREEEERKTEHERQLGRKVKRVSVGAVEWVIERGLVERGETQGRKTPSWLLDGLSPVTFNYFQNIHCSMQAQGHRPSPTLKRPACAFLVIQMHAVFPRVLALLN